MRKLGFSMSALFALMILLQTAASQSPDNTTASRLVGEVFTNGQQMKYLSMLSDGIGSRLTGSPGARRAEETMEAEMKRLGLAMFIGNHSQCPYRGKEEQHWLC